MSCWTKGKFSSSFWVDVLINKYRNHLPVERQLSEMKEYGLDISHGTIFGGFKKIHSLYLKPLYEAMSRELREASHYHADESGWRIFVITDDKKNYKWFIWIFISTDKKIVLFVLHPTRAAEVPLKVLFDIDIADIIKVDKSLLAAPALKCLNVDRFSSYKALENMGIVELSFCWSHQRRDFLNLKTKYPELDKWIEEWIEKIANLYHINNERVKYNSFNPLFKEYDEKLKVEIGKINSLINMEYSHPKQNDIMKSMKQHWKGLTLFVDHPQIPMDNNLAERMLRPMVVGRKNYWGNHSLWAGELTCAMFSIIQTCLPAGRPALCMNSRQEHILTITLEFAQKKALLLMKLK
ncbi:IS66 family transposase [Patescibacteria group bacterium]|nr:IS66 family transposase [Patescibacteria group bacterium]